jgi:hypothetical protein
MTQTILIRGAMIACAAATVFFGTGAALRAVSQPHDPPPEVSSGEVFTRQPSDTYGLDAWYVQRVAQTFHKPVPSFARADADRSDPEVQRALRAEVREIDRIAGFSHDR